MLASNGQQIDRGLRLYMKGHEKDLPPGVRIEVVAPDDTGANPEVARRPAREPVTRKHVRVLAGVVFTPNVAAPDAHRIRSGIRQDVILNFVSVQGLGRQDGNPGCGEAIERQFRRGPGYHDPADRPHRPIAIDRDTRDIVQNIYLRRVQKHDGDLVDVEFGTFPMLKDPWKKQNPAK